MPDIGVTGFYVQPWRIFEILFDVVDMWPARYEKTGLLCWQAFQHSDNLISVTLMLALIKRVNYDVAFLISLNN